MKIHQVVACALALACPASLAAAQTSGTAFGPWTKLNASSTTLDALLIGNDSKTPNFELRATLLGVGGGQISGTLAPLSDKQPPFKDAAQTEYLVLGDWIDLGDGRLFVHSQILVDMTQFGLEGLLGVGVFDGELLGAGVDLTGARVDTFTPIPPPTAGSNGASGGQVPNAQELHPIEAVRRHFTHLQPIAPVVRPEQLSPLEPSVKPTHIAPIDPTVLPLADGKFIGQWILF